jgi:hypothetical protein
LVLAIFKNLFIYFLFFPQQILSFSWPKKLWKKWGKKNWFSNVKFANFSILENWKIKKKNPGWVLSFEIHLGKFIFYNLNFVI